MNGAENVEVIGNRASLKRLVVERNARAAGKFLGGCTPPARERILPQESADRGSSHQIQSALLVEASARIILFKRQAVDLIKAETLHFRGEDKASVRAQASRSALKRPRSRV